MGMSSPMHEIARLCRITPPDIGVELNVLPVHVEHLGSIENVAKAKAELIEGLKENGTAVLNADDERVFAMRELFKGKILTFGFAVGADVRATDFDPKGLNESGFMLNVAGKTHEVLLPVSGRHNVSNALAAAAVGVSFGIPLQKIAEAFRSFETPNQRGEFLRFKAGFQIVNDSYNSNPAALISMVDAILESSAGAKRKIVVAGEMLELGADERKIHRETGQKIAKLGIDVLIGVRGLASELVAGAREAGMKSVELFSSSEEAGEFLSALVRAGDLILVKGSRGVKTEKVIEKLLSKFELESGSP